MHTCITLFYVLLTVHTCIIFFKQNQLGTQIFVICLLLLSTCFGQLCAHHQGKITVSMQHWYLSLCMDSVWSAGWIAIAIQPADHTPSIQSDKYQCCIDTVIFSLWWAHSCPKHVEKSNKYITKICAPSWLYLQKIGYICWFHSHTETSVQDNLLLKTDFTGWNIHYFIWKQLLKN